MRSTLHRSIALAAAVTSLAVLGACKKNDANADSAAGASAAAAAPAPAPATATDTAAKADTGMAGMKHDSMTKADSAARAKTKKP